MLKAVHSTCLKDQRGLCREAKRSEWRTKQQMAKQEQVNQKLSAAQAAEDAKMATFRAMVAQGPITIAKRQ